MKIIKIKRWIKKKFRDPVRSIVMSEFTWKQKNDPSIVRLRQDIKYFVKKNADNVFFFTDSGYVHLDFYDYDTYHIFQVSIIEDIDGEPLSFEDAKRCLVAALTGRLNF